MATHHTQVPAALQQRADCLILPTTAVDTHAHETDTDATPHACNVGCNMACRDCWWGPSREPRGRVMAVSDCNLHTHGKGRAEGAARRYMTCSQQEPTATNSKYTLHVRPVPAKQGQPDCNTDTLADKLAAKQCRHQPCGRHTALTATTHTRYA
jgi:hypothetical protein